MRFLLRREARAGRLALDADAADIEAGCGFVVLALGKHGARELNYSSDIDLIALFDGAIAGDSRRRRADAAVRAHGPGADPAAARAHARRLRASASICASGPIPSATPVALSIASAIAYYETLGQNWERAAMIKARPAAGDLALGARFLAELAPFIWRKYFDYAAIADIHAMKRQIHAARGHELVTVPGHDLKLGRGGIREIEFFVQTQQLIFGGRRPSMRGARTLDMLARAPRRATGFPPRRSPTSPPPMSSCAGSNIGCRWSPTSRRSACRSRPRRWRASPSSAATRGSSASRAS